MKKKEVVHAHSAAIDIYASNEAAPCGDKSKPRRFTMSKDQITCSECRRLVEEKEAT
jgi:hypothetical protein